jgi:hypothetical protein
MIKYNYFLRLMIVLLIMTIHHHNAQCQHSIARIWNEVHLECIRNAYAKPTVHARHLHHMGVVMYDAWAAYDSVARPYMLGRTVGGYYTPFDCLPPVNPDEIDAARDMAINHAAYTYLMDRYTIPAEVPPNNINYLIELIYGTCVELGYNPNNVGTDYQSGDPAQLGNYIGTHMLAYGLVDGSNQQGVPPNFTPYGNQVYQPSNFTLDPVTDSGNPGAENPNGWQPMSLEVCTDQAGNPVPCPSSNGVPALTAEWGNVVPFSLTECQRTYFDRAGHQWPIYLDPGEPPYLQDTTYLPDSILGPNINLFKFGFVNTLMWHHFHNNFTGQTIDTSPAHMGNLNLVPNPSSVGEIGAEDLPSTVEEFYSWYNLFTGELNVPSGYSVNPITNQPYATQEVPMADFSRATAQYWADGPRSETPPGHWFKLFNEVTDELPDQKYWRGNVNEPLTDLAWDVKSYFTLGGAVHDAAIACWSAKGAYDYTRPIFAIRLMADSGQCTNPALPNYHIHGLPLIDGYIELVTQADIDNPDLYFGPSDLNEIKIHTWLGPYGVGLDNGQWQGTLQDSAGWKLAKDWWTYQVATFVTPPFPGYYSGHSTYSRTAAEVLTQITGSEYFPGGLHEYVVDTLYADTSHLPSQPVHLQWAKYRDAADQCSLSRIFGGLHPPQDDIPGRKVGLIIGNQVVDFAESFMHANVPQLAFLHVNPISETATAADLQATVVFDQPMNTDVTPDLIITPAAAANNMLIATGTWLSPTEYQTVLTVLDTSNYSANIDIHMEAAVPDSLLLFGECPIDTLNVAPTNCLPVNIDIDAPTCITSMQPMFIADAEVNGLYNVHVEFSENMDTSSFNFEALLNNPTFNETFTWNNSVWISENSLELNFTIVDSNTDTTFLWSSLLLGADAAGNALAGCAISQVFEVDTYNPTAAAIVAAPDMIIADNDVLSGNYFTLTFSFDDEMDISIFPSIVFENDDPTLQTLSIDSSLSAWTSEFVFTAVYSLTDNNIELDDIVATISGVTDIHQNALTGTGVFIHPFAVDTRNPVIIELELSTDTLNLTNCDNGLDLTIIYDEAMSSDIQPTITLSAGTPPLTPVGEGSWNADLTEFTQSYSCTGITDSIQGIDITIAGNATDLFGNLSSDTLFSNQLDIDNNTRVSEIDTDDILVYPVPIAGGQSFHVKSPIDLISRITVYDAVGKLIFSTQPSATTAVVDTPMWSSGVYTLRIETTRNEFIKPILAID